MTAVSGVRIKTLLLRVWQVEPCHNLGWSSQALIVSILALGAMPKQQQQQQKVVQYRMNVVACSFNCMPSELYTCTVPGQ